MSIDRMLGALLPAVLLLAPLNSRAETTMPEGLADWALMLGDWELVERRYSFEGELIQTNHGRAGFQLVLHGQRVQEIQTLEHGEGSTRALHLFVFDPRSQELEIARTDSDHYGFSLLIGSVGADSIELLEKHPNPEHQVIRRVRYDKTEDGGFRRTLEFSTDQGESWFVRSEWIYASR